MCEDLTLDLDFSGRVALLRTSGTAHGAGAGAGAGALEVVASTSHIATGANPRKQNTMSPQNLDLRFEI